LDEVFAEVKVARLTFSALTSLDAFIADKEGNFERAEPDREVHAFLNDLEKLYGTYLYGRSMYDVMAAWLPMVLRACLTVGLCLIRRAADKIVFRARKEGDDCT
jgi:hypothetical protein